MGVGVDGVLEKVIFFYSESKFQINIFFERGGGGGGGGGGGARVRGFSFTKNPNLKI